MARRAVLFDAAGTLILLREGVGESYARLAARAGVVVPAERITEAFGRIFRAAPAMVFPELPEERVAAAERHWWMQRVRETFRTADPRAEFDDFEGFFGSLWTHFSDPGSWRLCEGAREALEALSAAGYRLALLSNFDLRLHGILRGLEVQSFFESVTLPSSARAAKPDPGIFLHALSGLGIAPEDAVYVGDDPLDDLAGARRAGLRAIDVTEVATLTQLPGRVARLFDDHGETA